MGTAKAKENEQETSSEEEEEEDGEGEEEESEEEEGDDKDDEQESEEDDEQSSEDAEESDEEDDDEESEEGGDEGSACENGEAESNDPAKEDGNVDAEAHALVPVVDESKKQVAEMRNSVTNKKEWDTFNRQAKTRMPCSLNSMYTSSKQELFNMWMDLGMDWSACSLEVERRHEQKSVSTKGWVAKQGKQLRALYSSEKFDLLVSKRKEQGLYYEDPDFPGDLDEPWMVYVYFFCLFQQLCSQSQLVPISIQISQVASWHKTTGTYLGDPLEVQDVPISTRGV